jgi:hypothetical protein
MKRYFSRELGLIVLVMLVAEIGALQRLGARENVEHL